MKYLIFLFVFLTFNSFAKEHTVIKGDTLYSISKNNNITVKELLKCNNLPTDYIIKENDTLKLCDSTPENKTPAAITLTDAEKEKTITAIIERSKDPLKFIKPNDGLIISSFGKQINGLHNDGINITPSKNDKVVSAYQGQVIYTGENLKGYGNTIIIKHEDNYTTIYSHLNEIKVSVGEIIEQGIEIGKIGNSGKFKKDQLHFEIRKNLNPLNPEKYFTK